MKISQDETFRLVHSLSNNEHTAFIRILQSAKHKLTKGMYRAMRRQSGAYDKYILIAAHPRAQWTRNYDVCKFRLGELLLSFLVDRYEHRGEEAGDILKLLIEIEILTQRGLYKKARKAIKAAQAISYAREYFWTQLKILKFEATVAQTWQEIGVKEVLQEIELKRKTCVNNIELLQDMQSLYEQIFLEIRGSYYPAKNNTRIVEYLNMDLLDPNNPPNSIKARSLYLECRAICLRKLQQFDAAKAIRLEELHMWNSHKQLLNLNIQTYIKVLANLANMCWVTRDKSRINIPLFEYAVNEIQVLKPTHEDDLAEQFQNLYYLKLWQNLTNGKLKECTTQGLSFDEKPNSLIETIVAGLDLYGGKINAARRLTFDFNIALIHYLQGKWSEAIFWLRQVERDVKLYGTISRKDIRDAAWILALIATFEAGDDPECNPRELKNLLSEDNQEKNSHPMPTADTDATDLTDVLETHFERTKKYFKSMNPTAFQSSMIKHFKKLHTLGVLERKSFFTAWLKHLSSDDFANHRELGLDESRIWLISKTSDKAISDVFRHSLNDN